jgi:hypothetical protein
MPKPHYLYESVLMSELILFNNLNKLKKDDSLFNSNFLQELEDLRDTAVKLERSSKKGLQKEKREIRNKIRNLSAQTYVYRDTDIFGEMISAMADRILTRPQFSNYTFKEDMKGLGIEYVLKYCNNFDPYKTSKISGQSVSAFAYISTIIFNGIIQVINTFNKEQEKIKSQIQERQKSHDNNLKYKDTNSSTYFPEFEDIEYKEINLTYDNLEKGLLKQMKKYTIHEPTMFIIPNDYRITEDDLHYIEKYTIGIKRINSDV